MRKITSFLFCALVALLSTLNLQLSTVHAQGTAFLYQGRLNDGGSPAAGNYDLRFQIYDAVTNGSAVSVPRTNSAIAVASGLFTVTLDFGPGIFTGPNRWLDIGVRTNGNVGAFTLLFPRQPVLPVPYAIFANTASNLVGSLAAAQLNGTLPASAFLGYTNTVTLTNGGNIFGGNGAGLTNLNGSQISSGTVADARLSANVALLNTNQTFTGSNIFTGFNTFPGTNNFTGANTFTNLYGNSFSGSFFGNGLVGWIVTNGTVIQAQIDHGYLLTNSLLVTVKLPPTPVIGDIVRISGAGASGWGVLQNAGQSIIGNFSGFTNSSWVQSGAPSGNWAAIAASGDGTKMVAAANGGGTTALYNSTDSGKTSAMATSLAVVDFSKAWA